MRKRIHELIQRLRKEHSSPGRLAGAVGLGVFVGTLPVYGLHFPICIACATALRLNRALTYLAANISNPLVAPVLVAVSIALGETLRFGAWRTPDLDQGRDFLDQFALLAGTVPDLFLSCLLGGVVLGAVLGSLSGLATWIWARQRDARRVALADDAASPPDLEEPASA